jgi:MerR family redox-sensitive transcriptional activator SoxR
MDEGLLSISEIARRTGLQSSALRYYEKAGLIKSSARVGGRRHYTPEVLQRLATIALLQEVGFRISEIAGLVRGGGHREKWRELAKAKVGEIDDHIDRVNQARELLTAALACGCSSLDTCELISARRGRHRKAVQTLSLTMGPGAHD